MIRTRIITEARMTMGEAPLWDAGSERLYWIDVFGATVHSSALDGGDADSVAFPGRSIAALAMCEDGGAIVTSGCRIHRFDLGSGAAKVAFDAGLGEDAGFNDGTVDRQGRFVTGTADGRVVRALTTGQGDPTPSGNLYLLDGTAARTIGDPIGVTNGPCFDRAGTTFYCNDSATRSVYAWDYDAVTGEATHRRLVTRFDEGHGIPDGATVDEEGHLWVAVYHGGEVRRYTPDGVLDRRVPLPVTSPTSVAFAGPALDVLVVTSRGGRSPTGDDGHVLTVHGLGVRGLPETRFGGGARAEPTPTKGYR